MGRPSALWDGPGKVVEPNLQIPYQWSAQKEKNQVWEGPCKTAQTKKSFPCERPTVHPMLPGLPVGPHDPRVDRHRVREGDLLWEGLCAPKRQGVVTSGGTMQQSWYTRSWYIRATRRTNATSWSLGLFSCSALCKAFHVRYVAS